MSDAAAPDIHWANLDGAYAFLKDVGILTDGQRERMAEQLQGQSQEAINAVIDATEEKIRDALTTATRDGWGYDRWQDEIHGIIDVAKHEAEAIGRTFTHQAYYFGQQASTAHPAVAEEFPYIQFLATDDNRTRLAHHELSGKVAHVNSPLADKMREEIKAWGCRCGIRVLTREEALEIGIDDDTGWKEPA